MRRGPSVLLFLAVVTAACGHEYSESGTTTVTAGTPTDPASAHTARAIDEIAAARCQREARCDNVGANRHYVGNDACFTQLKGEGMNELTASACPHGLDGSQLNKCLADIRAEHCENLLDTIGRLSSCSTSSLCPR
ncbi:MAG: DUF6184 family natural product biosynthesis lipoprotein [Polyangiales bacterium]